MEFTLKHCEWMLKVIRHSLVKQEDWIIAENVGKSANYLEKYCNSVVNDKPDKMILCMSHKELFDLIESFNFKMLSSDYRNLIHEIASRLMLEIQKVK